MRLVPSIIVSVMTAAFAPAAAEDLNLPPTPAPTVTVSVGTIPTVRSLSESAGDFASGLMAALPLTPARRGAVIIVDDGNVVTASGFGISKNEEGGVTADTPLDAGSLTSLLAVVAVLQLTEQGRLKTADDIAKPLGEQSPRGITLDQALTRESAGDLALILRAVEKISGETFPDYVRAYIFLPLGMNASRIDGGRLRVTPSDMSKFLLALSGEAAPILQPATLGRLTALRATRDPMLPGLTYGFAEMRRNGQRALQIDSGWGARLVVAPDAKLAYFIALGTRQPSVWRVVDDAVFDKVLPPQTSSALRGTPEQTAAQTPALAAARAVADIYQPVYDRNTKAALGMSRDRLRVTARADGALILGGAETGVLLPPTSTRQPPSHWQSADGNLTAVARNGFFFLNTAIYRPLPLWKRAWLYALLALALAVLGLGDARRRGLKINAVSKDTRVQGLGLMAASLAMIALLVLLLGPAV